MPVSFLYANDTSGHFQENLLFIEIPDVLCFNTSLSNLDYKLPFINENIFDLIFEYFYSGA